MQKSAPSTGKIAVAVLFTLSCFGLLLFLWVRFGGPIPLKAESYRVTAYFPEATQLAIESDVRIGGVSVGKVKTIELAPIEQRIDGQDTTKAEIEIQPEFAPISNDAEAILRQKTLLGETYVELTSGTEPTDKGAAVSLGASANNSDSEMVGIESIPEGGTLGLAQVENPTQIDEIFNALDEETRTAFQNWQKNAAVAISGRGQDLNDSLGNLGPFLSDASDTLEILKNQKRELKGVVRDTGEVFEALTERGDELAGVITNSNDVFGALAEEEAALREVIQIFPTFQRETRTTLTRLDEFQANTLPLIQDLQPVAEDLSPTLRSIRRLSPTLPPLFRDLDKLIDVSITGLPELRKLLDELAPTLEALDPFLANLNPVISYLGYHRATIVDFLVNPPVGLSGSLTPEPGAPSAAFVLRQLGYITEESLAIYPNRLVTNRGNGYMRPFNLLVDEQDAAKAGGFPSIDCDNSGGERFAGDGAAPEVSANFAPCFLARPYPEEFGGGLVPNVTADP